MRWRLVCILSVGLFDFCLSPAGAQISDGPARVDPPNTVYTSGDDQEIEPAIKRRLPIAEQFRAFLPASVDLANQLPAPGSQGKLPSCTAWAVAYAARGYYTSALEGRDLHQSANLASPGYVYHLARGPECRGTNIVRVVEILKQGALSVADYPYTDQCTPPPDPQVVSRAQDFRVRGYRRIDLSKIDDIKGQLAQSNPVLISFADSPAFHRHRGEGVFADPEFDAAKDGWHAMTLVGYDDRRQAFRLMNSWGRGWGDRGYAWLSYDLVRTRIREAGIIDVAKPPRPIAASTPPPVAVSPRPPKPQPPPSPQPPQPQLTSPPPAPPAPRAQFSDLQNLACGRVSMQRTNDRNVLAGYVGSAADFDLVRRVAANTPNASLGNVVLAPWPQCEALQTLERPLAAADRPQIDIGARSELRLGDPLRVEIRSPSQISYLYIAYIQADGSLVHLAQPQGVVPQPTMPNRMLVFGDGQDGRARFTVSPPFGREMIIAIASRSPLFERELPSTQTDREFLSELRRALIYKSSPAMSDREVAAAIVSLQTRAR